DGALRLGAVGLALASGMAAWVELSMLRRALRGKVGKVRLGGAHLGRTGLASAAAALVALGARLLVGPQWPPLALVLTGGPAAVTYLAAAGALGLPEARALSSSIRRRTRPIRGPWDG
ncbi:MAG: hypothetical protein M3R01_07385, partial [Actinomycetota bacterium]|nr:hypothetical protein [Actinomycetota bacterium]